MDWTAASYLTYLAVTVPLTIWVASTLSSNGQVFLEDVFTDNAALADAINKLLVVGFYLLNVGFVLLYLRTGEPAFGLAEPDGGRERRGRGGDGGARGSSTSPTSTSSTRSAAGCGWRACAPLRCRRSRTGPAHPAYPVTRVRLTVLYDDRARCAGLQQWLDRQPVLVPIDVVPAGSEYARRRFPTLDHQRTLEEMTVVGDAGCRVDGADAGVMCLWATASHRVLAE